MAFLYPEVLREDVRDLYHGMLIEDPYRWLEKIESDRTQQFIESQNLMTKSYLKSVKFKSSMKSSLTELCGFPKFEVPFKEGNNYFQFRSTTQQNIDILYYGNTIEELGVNRNEFFNPNTEIKNNLVLLKVKFSKNGKIMAYIMSNQDTDKIEIKFKNVEDKEDLKDHILNANSTNIEWLGEEGIIYSSFNDSLFDDKSEPQLFKSQKLSYHKLGKNQQDIVIYSIGSGHGELYCILSDDSKYLLMIHSVSNAGNEIYYIDIKENGPITKTINFKPVITNHEAVFEFIANNGDEFLFRTNKDAPHMRIISLNIKNPVEKYWANIVAENSAYFLERCLAINEDFMVLVYRQNARHIVKLHKLASGVEIMELPIEIGVVVNLSGKRKDTDLYLKFQSMVIPSIIYKIDLLSPEIETKVFQEVRLKDANNYEICQALYHSADGTAIHMYMLFKKGLMRNGLNPCLLSTYGNENDHVYPKFSIHGVFFVNSFNGIYAVANIRGGGQMGEKWFKAGSLENKQNSFDDFQYAAKHLFSGKYTCPSRLIIYGTSRGGLLVSACINQAPELFGAAIIENADLDILRHNEHTYSNTRVIDYGHPLNPHHFEFLRKISPLQNINIPKKKAQYPATLLFVEAYKNKYKLPQALKFIAKLQYIIGKLPHQKNPLMVQIDLTSKSFKSKEDVLNDWLNMFCFIGKALDLHYDEYPFSKKRPLVL